MIAELVEQWEARKRTLEQYFRSVHPASYQDILDSLLRLVLTDEVPSHFSKLDPARVTVVDDGDYQGCVVFIIPMDTYQPSPNDYVWTHNFYGSCSGCDTLIDLQGYGDEKKPPTHDQTAGYMELALHLLQRMKWLDEK